MSYIPSHDDPRSRGRAIRQARRERVRGIRRRAVGSALALFVATWLLIAMLLVSGHDPALARNTTRTTAGTGSAASTNGSTGSGTGGSNQTAASSTSTSSTSSTPQTSSSSGATQSSGASSLTSSQS